MHPHIHELKYQYQQGKITRREFVRMTALLGLSLTSISSFLSACSREEDATQPAEKAPTQAPTLVPAKASPTAIPAAGPKRGGSITAVNTCSSMDDPHTVETDQNTVFKNVAEPLALINPDNIAVPWLLERWEPSEDLMTWDLHLRKGIKFNHGPEMTADDVVFNYMRWLDPNNACPVYGLLSTYLSSTNVEKVNDYQVRLHLDKPQVAIPEHLEHMNCCILPRDFEPPWTENSVGTGAYMIKEFLPEERIILQRREGYWRMGLDGRPLPYMDEIVFLNVGQSTRTVDTAPAVAGLGSGELDIISINAATLDALQGVPGIVVKSQVSSWTPVIRMRADRPPFNDVRVCNAVKACQDRSEMLEVLYRGYGALGEDHHVAPIHPEYCPMDIPERDIEKAKALLAEAGYENGIELKLSVISGEPYITVGELLKGHCAPAGINIILEPMPSSMYWDQWTEVDFGVTDWAHRPLGIQVLGEAYRTGVGWNETHWSNEHFDQLLDEAEGTFDVEKRREIMCELQTIQKEEGTIGIPFWASTLNAHTERVKNFRAAPGAPQLYDVWLDEEA